MRRYRGKARNGLFGAGIGPGLFVPGRDGSVAFGEPGRARGVGGMAIHEVESGELVYAVAGEDLPGGPVRLLGWSIAAVGSGFGTIIAAGAPGTDAESDIPPSVVVGDLLRDGFQELYRLEGPPGSSFGASVDMIALNDAPAFFSVSAPDHARGRKAKAGAVFLFDADGDPRWMARGSRKNARFGAAVEVLGDAFGGDGIYDLAVGAPGPAAKRGKGRVIVLDGQSGRTRMILRSPAGARSFGAAVSAAEFDGDGVVDFVVGAPDTDTEEGEEAGAVYVVSGADRSIMAEFLGTAAGQRLGSSVETVGDLDGDVVWEIALGSTLAGPGRQGERRGRIDVVTLASRETLFSLEGDKAGRELGSAIHRFGDVDQDGAPEFLVGRTGGERGLPD